MGDLMEGRAILFYFCIRYHTKNSGLHIVGTKRGKKISWGINSFQNLDTWIKLVLQLFGKWGKTNSTWKLFFLHCPPGPTCMKCILVERAHDWKSEASLPVLITQLSVNFPHHSFSGSILIKGGWTCWALRFSLAQHFCNSRGLPATFWENKPRNRRRTHLCIKKLSGLHIVGAHNGGWNWWVEGIKWQTSNCSVEIHVHAPSSVLPSLTHSRQLLTVAPGTMPGCHFSNL